MVWSSTPDRSATGYSRKLSTVLRAPSFMWPDAIAIACSKLWASRSTCISIYIPINCIINETRTEQKQNSLEYLPFTSLTNAECMYHMNLYFFNKIWNLQVLDVIPMAIANAFNIQIHILKSAMDYTLIALHQRDTCFPYIIIYFANIHYRAVSSDVLVCNALAYTTNDTISTSSTRWSIASPMLTSSSTLVAATVTLLHINALTSLSLHAAAAPTLPHVNASISLLLHKAAALMLPHINVSTFSPLPLHHRLNIACMGACHLCWRYHPDCQVDVLYNDNHNLSTVHCNVQRLLSGCYHAKLDHLRHILSLTN